MEQKMNLYQKIQAVANEVKNISKNMTVGKGNYSYKAVGDIDVTLKVKEAEKKVGIVSIPIKQELIHHEIIKTSEGDKESIKYSFLIKMTTRINDLEDTDSFIEIESFGHGLDSGDKGFGKASTYARKYALLNAYKIATGEDPDDTPSKKMTVKKDEKIRNKVIDYMEGDMEYKLEVFTFYNINDYVELDDSKIISIAKSIEKKGIKL